MPTTAELQRRRKSALREVRRAQRQADTLIERLERRIFALLNRKTLIDEEDAAELYDRYWRDFWMECRTLEGRLVDFFNIVAAPGSEMEQPLYKNGY